MTRDMLLRSDFRRPLFRYLNQRHAINATFRYHNIPVMIDHHVANDTAARWDRPSLEPLAGWIETHERIWPHAGLARANGPFRKSNAVGL